MNTFSFISFTLFFIVFAVKGYSPQAWVYSSEYDTLISKTEDQGMINNIKVAKNANLIFVAAGDSGVKVIDPTQNYSVICTFRSDVYIEGFAVTSDANYVFLQYQNKFTVFNFSSRTSFVQVSQDSTSTIEHKEMIINKAETIVFILQITGNIRAINISNKSNPTLAGQVTWFSSLIFGGFISSDDKWLLICQGNQGLGVYQVTYNAGGTVTYFLAGSYSSAQTNSNAVTMTSDMHYIMNIDNRKGVSIADFTQITGAGGVYTAATYATLEWWPSNVSLPAPYSITISSDNNYLFMGVLSTGIMVIDVTTKSTPTLYETIIVPFQGMSVKLSIDESYLYYANAESFQAFPKTTPNLNDQYLNLFNGHLSAGYTWSNTYYYWRCVIDDATGRYYGAFDDDGLWIVDASNPQAMSIIQKQLKPPASVGDVDIFIFKNGFANIIVPTIDGVNVIAVYTTSDLITNGAAAVPIQTIAYNTANQIADFDVNSNESILVAALGNSVIFFDVTTLTAYTIKKVWTFTTGMMGTTTGVMFSNNDKYLLAACRGYGYFILDVSNWNNVNLVNYINSLGAENLQNSAISNDYAFFIDGLQGIMVIDFTKLPQVDFLSQISINGWSNDITFLNNEKMMLVSTLEQGMLTIIDMSNILAPFFVGMYQYENQNGMTSCALADSSYLFINNNIGVRALPTISPVQMHVEIQQILGFSDILNTFLYAKQSISTVFSVGMSIQVDIVFLYQPLDLIVDNVYIYQLQGMESLPTWINYDPVNVSLSIDVVKEAIDPTNMDAPLLNTLVLKTLNPLYLVDFNYNTASCATTAVQNQAIYTYVLANGLIDDSNVVSPNLQFTSQQEIIVFPNSTPAEIAYNQCISSLIKFTLLNSIQYAPIYLFMKSSLVYTPQPADSLTYIQTVVSNVVIDVVIPKFSGQFIYENQVGVNIEVNLEKNHITLSGSVENVNNYLAAVLILYPLPGVTYSSIKANLTISDNMNYDIQKSLPITQISFIQQKQDIIKNSDPNLSIQSQLEQQYSNGDIQILTSFLFSFDQGTFVSPDIGSVTYTAYIEQGGKFVAIDTQYWISFYAPGFKFYGSPPESAFESSVTIKLIGDDGYQQVSDTFVIRINQLPALFVIQWIAQVLGPLVGVFGMYKYRNIFYNAFFKKRIRYSKVYAQVNEKFVFKIPLVSSDIKQAKDMIEALIQRVNKEQGGKSEKIDLLKIAKEHEVNFNNVDEKELPKHEEEKNQNSDSKKEQDVESIGGSKENGIMLQDSISKTDQKEIPKGQQPQHNYNTDKRDITNQFIDKIAIAKTNPRASFVEKKYLKATGELNMELVIQDMLKFNVTFKVMGKELEAKAYQEELQNSKSTLYKCIKLLLCRYLIIIDDKSHLVTEYIKYYGKQNCFLFTLNDWYKQFVNIISDEKLDKYGHTIVFPKVQLIHESLNTVLLNIKLVTSRFENINSLSTQGINPYLIKQNLIADALGIDLLEPSSLFPSQGESIHLKSSDFKSVESYKYAPGGACFSLKKFLDMEYDPYGPKENMQFPNWLQLIMQPGVVILSGIPQQQDMEEILIRFYGLQGYIYRSFTLRVQDSQGNSSRSQVVSTKLKTNKEDTIIGDENSGLLNNSPLNIPKKLGEGTDFKKGSPASLFASGSVKYDGFQADSPLVTENKSLTQDIQQFQLNS